MQEKNPKENMKSLLLCLVFVIIIIGVFLVIVLTVGQMKKSNGVVWNIDISKNMPELAEIQKRFAQSCKVPEIPPAYFTDTLKNETFQAVRRESIALKKINDEKYDKYELEAKNKSEWSEQIETFFSSKYNVLTNKQDIDLATLFSTTPIDYELKKCHAPENLPAFIPFLGYYKGLVDTDVANFAKDQINALVSKLELKCHLPEKIIEGHYVYFKPPQGFEEQQTEQLKFPYYRFLFTHVVDNKEGAFFIYRQPVGDAVVNIPVNNQSVLMYRIRKNSEKSLLRHSSWNENCSVFSWSFYIPSKLAQRLKHFAIKI
jgi:hypothetical protein